MAYFKNGLFQKWPISKNGLFQNFCRRHNYRKRDVFSEKNVTTFGNALYIFNRDALCYLLRPKKIVRPSVPDIKAETYRGFFLSDSATLTPLHTPKKGSSIMEACEIAPLALSYHHFCHYIQIERPDWLDLENILTI